jgi:hypothetical protein
MRASRRAQRGSAVLSALALTAILAILVTLGLSLAGTVTGGSGHDARSAVALQAADAGVNHYMARLVDDRYYYSHFVDPAEEPRIPVGGGAPVPPGVAWPGGAWTYADGPPQTWFQLHDGSARFGTSQYSLRVFPPGPGSDLVTIQSVGRVGADRPNPVARAVEARLEPTNVSDFQMISDRDITYGNGATTNGKIYSNGDINHRGTAGAELYAAGQICDEGDDADLLGRGILTSTHPNPCSASETVGFAEGAYDSASTPGFEDKVTVPIDFSRFEESRLAVKAAAQTGGVYRKRGGGVLADAWFLRFRADGKVDVYPIISLLGIGMPLEVTTPLLGCGQTLDIPANGAMYFEEPVLVSSNLALSVLCNGATVNIGSQPSVVDGRVTVASSDKVMIGGNIAYETSGDDVLGLIARHDMVISALAVSLDQVVGSDLSIRAASIAVQGEWRTYLPLGIGLPGNLGGLLHDRLEYTGMQATKAGFDISQYQTSEFVYDETLRELVPPYFPIFEGSWRSAYWREITAPA